MTDEEMADAWLDKRYLKDMGVRKPCKEAFLAGLRAGRDMVETGLATAERFKLKWHDLRKNPKDLPGSYTTVLDENGNKIEYIGYGKWEVYSDYYERYIEIDPPIAWCEIPTFKE